jgi:SagB-type dehydrogenase family enzyme
LLDQGHVAQATQVFEAILARLGDAPSYGRGVILGRVGRCFHVGGRPDLAVPRLRDALGVIGRLPPSDGVKILRSTLRSDLGEALRAMGRYDDARKAHEAALKIAEELKDRRAQGVELGRLGALGLAEGELEEALTRYRAALLLFQQLREPAMQAVVWHELGRVLQEQRQWDEAERHYREAIDLERRIGDPNRLAHCLTSLADLLQSQPGRLVEARRLAEEGLAIAQSRDPTAAEVWTHYGTLADITDKEAASTADTEHGAALQTQARDYRQLQRYAPQILATLTRLNDGPSYGRAVILERLGQCFRLCGRPDLAIVQLREAIGITGRLAPSDGVKSLRGMLQAEFGDALRVGGQYGDARDAYEAALKIAEELQDVRGQGLTWHWLGTVCQEQGQSEQAERCYGEAARIAEGCGSASSIGPPSAFGVTLYEDRITDYAFDTDLLVDGPREQTVSAWTGEPDPVAGDVRPMLVPCARTWMDEAGAVRFGLPQGEPIVERDPGCIVMRRTRREVAISGNPAVLWRLIRRMDGANTVAEILSMLPTGERAVAARLLAVLAATGTIDVSGRPIGRFLHWATKKGVLPGGGLEGDAVLQLATDGNYGAYPGAPRIAVGQSIPDRLRTFHALTRSRRSHRDFRGLALRGADFDALLYTACGVTGAMPGAGAGAGHEAKLRAYPSSGALYAVEIYPVVFRVEGLEPAVYHYRAVEHVLEVVTPGIDRARVVAAALPADREMLAGAAALCCLTGRFPRHERKYGEGGYRMLVAEAGHISQNLVLAATALGLSARPFGGVFDDVLNQELGLHGAEEQFLLGVLVGHAGGQRGALQRPMTASVRRERA